jgi:MoaA/NifB/PqqE/SkfB family radical SAM enzyme
MQVPWWQHPMAALLSLLRAMAWCCGALPVIIEHALRKVRRILKAAISAAHLFVPGRISRLFFFVTSRCNAACPFCLNKSRLKPQDAGTSGELTIDEIRKVAQNLGRMPYLTMSGGEPFLRSDLAEIVTAFYEECGTQWVTIPTNGSQPSRIASVTLDILRRCPDVLLTVLVSVDGIGKDHDESRGVPGLFEKTSEALRRLAGLRAWSRNLRIGLSTCLTDRNMDSIEKIFQHCRSHFACDSHDLYLLRDEGLRITKSHTELVEPFLEIRERAIMMGNSDGRSTGLWGRVLAAFGDRERADLRRAKGGNPYLYRCHATRKFVTLYEDGSLAPCEVLGAGSLGNLRHYDYDLYRVLKQGHEFYRREIVDARCCCDWDCAFHVNMLYDPPSMLRLVGSLFRSRSRRGRMNVEFRQ